MRFLKLIACVAADFCGEEQAIELAAILDARTKGKLGRKKNEGEGEGGGEKRRKQLVRPQKDGKYDWLLFIDLSIVVSTHAATKVN